MAILLNHRRVDWAIYSVPISFLTSFPTNALSTQRILFYSFLYIQNEWIFILKVSFCLFQQQPQQQQQEIGNTNTVALSCLIIGH